MKKLTGPILVATDGTSGSAGARQIAARIARHMNLSIRLVSVNEPLDIFGATSPYILLPDEEWEKRRAETVQEEIEGSLSKLPLPAANVSVEVLVGSVAPSIAEHARQIEASAIVVGAGRSAGEVALRVMNLANTPVLSVPASARELPRTGLVAVDFSSFSEDAVRMAALLLGGKGVLHIVHVSPPFESRGSEWVKTYEEGLRMRMDRVANEAAEISGVETHTHTPSGRPAQRILELAEKLEADLIAVGSHGHSFLDRILAGSVSSRILRKSQRIVLVTPPRDPAKALESVEYRVAATSEPTEG